MADASDNEFVSMNSSFTCLSNKVVPEDTSPKTAKIRRYQLHGKTYSAKWELDPNYRGWVQRSLRGEGYFYCSACNKHYTCGKSELDKHASSKKHCLNLRSMMNASDSPSSDVNNSMNTDGETNENVFLTDLSTPETSLRLETNNTESKEESFGRYIVGELKRIKKKKTYELVKWEILQTLQKAMLKEVETEDSED